MALELDASSTHEEIEAFVDEVVSRQEEEKRDGQMLAEDGDREAANNTADDGSGDDTAPAGDEADWLDDDLKAELSAYGISEEEARGFAGRDELERAMRLFDKAAMDAGRKALADGDVPERDEKGRFVKQEAPEQPVVRQEGRFEVSLDPDVYDDGLISEFTRLRDHYESRLSALEERLLEQDAKVEEQIFDGYVDGLGMADFFGTTGKENAKQLERRQDLHVAVKVQQVGLQMLGRPVELDQGLVMRAARMAFPDETMKKELKSRTKRLAKQSNSRQGGGAPRASEPGESLMDEMKRLYKELEGA